jgi:hypothetical protein
MNEKQVVNESSLHYLNSVMLRITLYFVAFTAKMSMLALCASISSDSIK